MSQGGINFENHVFFSRSKLIRMHLEDYQLQGMVASIFVPCLPFRCIKKKKKGKNASYMSQWQGMKKYHLQRNFVVEVIVF